MASEHISRARNARHISLGGRRTTVVLAIMALAIGLNACGPSTADFERELWARGAENNASSPCALATCYGY